MLLHLQHTATLIPQTNPTKSASTATLLNKQKASIFEVVIKKRSNSYIVSAGEEDSEFEVDPDKAREALRKLDEQLQSLSKKELDPPKPRVSASDLNRAKGPSMKEQPPEVSESFLAYSAFYLLLFTIFYNVLFLTVIKPAIDGPDSDIISLESQEAAPLRLPISVTADLVEP